MGNVGSQKSLSEFLSRQLDEHGFSQERIQERINFMKKLSEAKDISTKKLLNRDDIEKIFVGSQREGTGLNHCNDLDVLQINHGVSCRIDVHPPNTETGKVTFQAVQKDKNPGYVLLKLQSEGNNETFQKLEYALAERNGEKYLSSEIFMTRNEDICQDSAGWIGKNTKYHHPEGPSIPKRTNQNHIESSILSDLNLETKKTDVVRAFPCEAIPIIEEWSQRMRRSGWPSKKTIANEKELTAYVVPVGQRGSEDEDLQWRVCFTKTEIHLIEDFNIIQTKISFLMKLIAKHYLQPISNDVTSYVVKNVMLWMSEEIEQERFCQDDLVARLGDTIKYLKNAVEKKHLSNYMIPKRNLFEGKIKDDEKVLIMDKLNFLLENGETLLKMYLTNPDQLPKELKLVRVAKEIETVQIEILASLTKEQIAEIYIQMISCQSQESMICHNILYNAVPFLNIYGTEWLSKPLSICRNHRKLLENSFRKCMCGPEDLSKIAINKENDNENEEIWRLRCLFVISCICAHTTLLCLI